jgi:DNA-binding PadR family transcriptional regulator
MSISDNNGRRCGGMGCQGGGRRGFGRGMGRGFGGDGEMMRGRMLAQGDLRLIALALIAEQPRHGYDIIKVLEEKTAGVYAPSPGVVYPTLTFLEDLGYLSSQQEGTKKLYVLTEEGRSHLADNRAIANAVLDRLAALGERALRQRDDQAEARDELGPGLPALLRAALLNLQQVAAQRLAQKPDAEAELVSILARTAAELRKA